MTDLESRLLFIEQLATKVDWQLQQLKLQLQDLANRQRQGSWATGTGGGSTAGYFGCILSGALAGGVPGGPLTGQRVWQLSGGVRVDVTTSGAIYNDTPNGLDAGDQALLAPNPDGTWTAIGRAC